MAASFLTSDRSRFVVVVMVVLQLLAAAQRTQQASTRAAAASSLPFAVAASGDTIRLDVAELRKLGISADDLLRHIRLLVDGRRVDGGCAPGSPSPAGVPMSPDDHSAPGGGELHRRFVRNKTTTCNDGSKAGSVSPVL